MLPKVRASNLNRVITLTCFRRLKLRDARQNLSRGQFFEGHGIIQGTFITVSKVRLFVHQTPIRLEVYSPDKTPSLLVIFPSRRGYVGGDGKKILEASAVFAGAVIHC